MTIEIFTNQESEEQKLRNDKFVYFVKEDRNGTKIFGDCRCRRCGGTGNLPYYNHVEGGVCFSCEGSGEAQHGTEIRIYTTEYGNKLKANRGKREEAKKAKLIAEGEGRRNEWKEKEGFNLDGITWMFLGNTFEIKDELKAMGAKFNPILGWHIDHEVEGKPMLAISVDKVTDVDYKGDFQYKSIYVREGEQWYDGYNFGEYVKKLREEAYAEMCPCRSEYVGEIKERREFSCKLVDHFTFETHYSWYGEVNYLYKFEDENGNIIVWSTSTYIDEYFEEGKKDFKFKATIKEHSEYKGEKQTVVTRPKFF